MRVDVQLGQRAERDLARLPAPARQRILHALGALAAGSSVDLKPLQGHPGWYRLRIGTYRVLLDGSATSLTARAVLHRRDLEATLRRL